MVQGLSLDEIKERNPTRWELTGDGQMLFELEGEDEKVALACWSCGNTKLQFGVKEEEHELVFPVLCHNCGRMQIVFIEPPKEKDRNR